jgi:hypothetical protein
MNKQGVIKILNAIGFGYGITALVAPDLVQRIYGTAETTPELRQMTRLWGTTVLSVSAIAATAREEDQDKVLLAVAVGNALAATAELYAAAGDALPAKVALPGAATSAAVAGACFWARTLS